MKRAVRVLHFDQGIRDIPGRSDRLRVAHDMLPEQGLQLGVLAVLIKFIGSLVDRHIPASAAAIGTGGGNALELPVIRRFGDLPERWHQSMEIN